MLLNRGCGLSCRAAAMFLAWLAVPMGSGDEGRPWGGIGVAPAFAQSDVFTVRDVAVDSTADTAAAARELALANGQRQAYERLFKKLTPFEYHDQIPAPRAVAVGDLVQGIEIEEEKTSSTRYLANLIISFKKEAVRDFLRSAGLPFSETPSKPLLVLPIYENAGARTLWDEPNPWLYAWRSVAQLDSVVPFVLPVGDLADVAAIGADQALRGDAAPMRTMARRYGVEDVLVAHAVLTHDLANNVPRLHVTLRRFAGSIRESVVIESFTGVSRTMIDVLIERAAGQIAARIGEDWKQATLLRFEEEGRISVRVPMEGVDTWVSMRSALKQTAAIRKISILEIMHRAAQMELEFLGSPSQLAVALAQRDLDLVEEDGYWSLTPRDGTTGGPR
jgi:hypothetical protein